MNIEIEKKDEVQERLGSIEGRLDLLEVIIKKAMSDIQPKEEPEEREKMRKVIQINAKGKKYFCMTSSQERIFAENNPGVETESFHLELLESIAEKYLNDPENKKQFTEKAKETVKV